MIAPRVLGAAALLAVTGAMAAETAPAAAAPPASAAAPPAKPAAKPAAPARAEPKAAAAGVDARAASWPEGDRPKVTPGVLVRAAKRAQEREAAACGPCAAQGAAQSIEIDWRAAPATP